MLKKDRRMLIFLFSSLGIFGGLLFALFIATKLEWWPGFEVAAGLPGTLLVWGVFAIGIPWLFITGLLWYGRSNKSGNDHFHLRDIPKEAQYPRRTDQP